MSSTITTAARPPIERPAATSRSHRALLAGVVAGPLWVVIAGIQAATRDGFDLARHPISVMANGDLGWIQIASFLVSGLLLIAAGRALRREIATGVGAKWIPRLVTAVGIGMIASGVFVADPLDGFPEGTAPGRPDQLSWHGGLHYLFSSLSFACFVALAFIASRRAAAQRDRSFAYLSAGCVIGFLLTWVGVMSMPDSDVATVAFTVGICSMLIWSGVFVNWLRHH